MLNERNEWDLPGGKINASEDAVLCLKREVLEELSLNVQVEQFLGSFMYKVAGLVNVFTIVYSCKISDDVNKSCFHFLLCFF